MSTTPDKRHRAKVMRAIAKYGAAERAAALHEETYRGTREVRAVYEERNAAEADLLEALGMWDGVTRPPARRGRL